jgi:hypothetical protein
MPELKHLLEAAQEAGEDGHDQRVRTPCPVRLGGGAEVGDRGDQRGRIN